MTSAYASSILRKTLCYASRSKKPQNQTQRADFPKNGNIQKPKPLSFMLLLFALLCGWPAAWGQDYPDYPANVNSLPEWNGENRDGDAGGFKVTGYRGITSCIAVNGNLHLYPVSTNGEFPVIERKITGGDSPMFLVENGDKLYIIGNSTNQLVLRGGTGNTANAIPTNNPIWGAAIKCEGTPELRLKYVNIESFLVTANGNGEAVVCMLGAGSNGKCYMDHTNIRNCFAGAYNTTNGAENAWGRIVGIRAGTWEVIMDNVHIHDCIVHERLGGYYHVTDPIDGMGGIIRSQGNVAGSLTMRNCQLYNNQYRDLSASSPASSYFDNYSAVFNQPLSGQGGSLNWRSGAFAEGQATQVTISNCTFDNNCARRGGAISTCATISMTNTEIKNNTAELGGGVYFWTYCANQATYDGRGFDADFGDGVNIHDNTATQYGGGAYVGIDASDDVGFTANNSARDSDFRVNITGTAKIQNNQAPKGAGIAIRDSAPKKHRSNRISDHRLSGEYTRTITINGGTVSNNTAIASNGSMEVAGGGIYIEKYKKDYSGITGDNNYSGDYAIADNGGTLTVEPKEGAITDNKAFIENETNPGYGGGLYIANPMLSEIPSSSLIVNVGESGSSLNVSNNKAYTNGGGFCVLGGIVTVTGSGVTDNQAPNGFGGGFYINVPSSSEKTIIRGGANISRNTAKGGGGVYVDKGEIDIIGSSWDASSGALVPSVTTRITNNTATDNDGGGVYLYTGKINIYGSNISHNAAIKGNGGGIYTNEGDILVWPTAMKDNPDAIISQCELTKTTVSNNTAGGNGGGLNTHIGRFDVRFAQITENIAGHNYSTIGNGGGNGGGLFCNGTEHDNGYTVRLLHCDLEENKALGNVIEGEGISGRGGGVYLKHGSIFAEHCDIIKNEADINGGGLDNHSGELRVYGTYIDENVAKTGKGGGLYTEEGNIVVGPCDTYGYTASKASRIIKNKAKINGGGINNHKGDITIHGDIINENEAEEGDGGGVYINSGNIFMYGGQINNNKADKGKGGGVYGGGGQFNIMERKANPIVEILEVEDIKATQFKVHYHLVDRGLAPITVAGDAPDYTYSDPGNLTHGIAYSSTKDPSTTPWTTASDSTVITYTTGTHEYVLSEGCVRIPVTGLTSGTTYYIIAWAKYTISEGPNAGNYYDASPVMEITAQNPTKQGKAPQGPRSVYPVVEENPFFQELTPLQQAMLANTPEGDTTAAPASRAITDWDDPNPQSPVNIPQINGNTAMFGGGICIDKKGAELIFAGTKGEIGAEGKGQINLNYASEAGGGIYIGRESADQYAQMQMMGKCEVNYNHVPAGKQGGGIYLDGRLYVGDKPDEVNTVHGLFVDRNFTSDIAQTTWVSYTWTSSLTPTGSKLNNVFLPRSDYHYQEHENQNTHDNKISVIALLSDISGWNEAGGEGNNASTFDPDKGDTPYSHIGFSVLKGFCPVIATSESFGGVFANVFSNLDVTPPVINPKEAWLYKLMLMSNVGSGGTAEKLTGAIFEDTESYVAVHTRNNTPPFLGKFIYLWGCWTHPIVRFDPETEQPMKGSTNIQNPNEDDKWKGHYVIVNPGDNTNDGENNNALVWHIYSPEGLAWFTSYVNGLNVFDEASGGKLVNPQTGQYYTGEGNDDPNHLKWNANKNPKAKAIIMNDLDMSAYLWVPIGSVQKFYNNITGTSSLFNDSEETVEGYTTNEHKYCGEFDGQGHIIKGLQGLFLTGIKKFGLFGYLTDGAKVKNVFVDEGLFMSDNPDVEYAAGGIAGEMDGGTLTNSEARMNFNSTYSKLGTTVGGLVGNMKNGHVHSCMAMPSFTTSTTTTDQYVGGLVGKMETNTRLKNSFANVLFTTTPNYRVGGISGYSKGLIENVYVRYNNATNTPDLPNDRFYWISGGNTNANVISYCFAPFDKIGGSSDQWWLSPNGATNRRTYQPTNLVDGKYGFAHEDQNVSSYGGDAATHIDSGPMDENGLKGLLASLNKWVAAKNAITDNNDPDYNQHYTKWTRTMASTINDDYPVLMFNDFNVVGTEDGIYMKYDDNVNDMWKKPNYESLAIADRTGKDFQGLTSYNNPKAAMYLYNTNPTDVNVSRNEAVRLYIHENVGITQTNGAILHARVGVTFDNSNKSLALGGKAYDWHMFSSALQSAPMGLKYYDDIENYPIQRGYESLSGTPTAYNGITENNYTSRVYMDPPRTSWYQSDNPSSILNNYDANKIGYFPTNTPYGSSEYIGSAGAPATFNGSFDFYCFSEQHRHWINFKRQGRPASQGVEKFFDHWHQDANDLNGQLDEGKHYNIEYPNESTFQVGKGYMMGVSAVSMLMADGTLNNGDGITTPITNNEYSINPSPYAEELRGTNLVGNPFQSYLDFDKLANDPANNDIIHNKSYYLFDADAGRYLCYPADASVNHINAPQFIHPHQGFFVKTANGGNLTFKNYMRSATAGEGSTFRGDNLNYPLVNLFCYDAGGHYDVTTVEMNRPKLGGGSKLKDMRNGNSLIYARLEDKDYQTLFAPTGTSTVPVRFEPSQDGVYTMRWGTLHGNFHYLHLIDNMSGADVDMLRSEEYRFEATTSDYISRFKLVFEATDVEENPIEAEATTFAFCMGDEIIVNGTGYLEVFDVQGRRLSAKRLVDAQSSVSLPNVAAGIYFLRLSDDKQVRTQKMVINY